jgi:hypothetical protein
MLILLSVIFRVFLWLILMYNYLPRSFTEFHGIKKYYYYIVINYHFRVIPCHSVVSSYAKFHRMIKKFFLSFQTYQLQN